MSLAPQLWPVTADPGQVEQVLLNLAMNARDAMPNGGTFSIETHNLTIDHGEVGRHPGLTPGPYVCLGVRDSGAGMEPHILERAFEPFFTTKPIVEGGGLGLAGVYGIINQAGGTVDISSAPRVGTTITAWLPATLDGEHQQALTSAGQQAKTPADENFGTALSACGCRWRGSGDKCRSAFLDRAAARAGLELPLDDLVASRPRRRDARGLAGNEERNFHGSEDTSRRDVHHGRGSDGHPDGVRRDAAGWPARVRPTGRPRRGRGRPARGDGAGYHAHRHQ